MSLSHTLRWSLLGAIILISHWVLSDQLRAQAGLRESLDRLDKNQDGKISPDEITPLARPYLERITKARRMSIDQTNDIVRLQEAARIYYALHNGVAGQSVRPKGENSVKGFGTDPGEPLVPEFGLAEVKYAYVQDDLDEADRTLGRYDRNRDGFIDRAEAAVARWTHRDPFEMDLNKDNRLNRLELGQRYARRRLLDSASGELRRKAWRTGSGIRPSNGAEAAKRNDSQWRRRGGSRYYLTATVLGRFDANRNGRLERNEAEQLGVPPGRIDIDRDGELSREELHAYLSDLQDEAGDAAQEMPIWFFELDANRDGQVAMSEFTTEWTDEKIREFSALDTNGDGLLTSAEASQSKAVVGGSYRNQIAEVLPPRKTIISEIEVSEDYLIADLNVQVSITHTYASYLDAYLTGPDGQRIELFSGVGGSDDHFDQTVLDDQSRYPIVKAKPPFKGTFQPGALVKRQPGLSHFNGKNVKGVWQLVVRGTRSERFGMLHSWGLIVKPQTDSSNSMAAAPVKDGPQATSVYTPSARRESSSTATSGGSPGQVRILLRPEDFKRFNRGDSRERDDSRAKIEAYPREEAKRTWIESRKRGNGNSLVRPWDGFKKELKYGDKTGSYGDRKSYEDKKFQERRNSYDKKD